MTECQLRLDEGVLGDHNLVFVLFRFLIVGIWNFIGSPLFRLLGQGELKRDLHFTAVYDF